MSERAEPSTPSATIASTPMPKRSSGTAAMLVGAGILLSRVLGVAREILKARYLGGTGARDGGLAGDAFNAAFRIPNLLQNLFGEGALSASFIPVYANLLARGDRREADRVAGAVAALLALVVAAVVALGVVFTPYLIPLIAVGFRGEKRELAITITRILFPGAGLFVLSAWCLGVLNSHRRFFLSYAAPVLWNVAMIAALLGFGPRQGNRDLAVTLAWASVMGAALQFVVQLPVVFRLAPDLRFKLDATSEHVRRVVRNFVPVFVSRGVVQISAYVDQLLASLLPNGMVSLLFYSQTISTLPVSLFGMAISAAELPEMASVLGSHEEAGAQLRKRLDAGLRRIAYFVVPSAVAFVALGDVITRTLFQHGEFTALDTMFSWGILAGSAVGLLASTLGRLYSSTYYALHDTRTPLRFAIVRVLLTTALGYLFALPLPRALGIDPRWGAAGLTVSAGIAGWVEFALLRTRLNVRIGRTGAPARFVALLWAVAVVAAAAAFGLKLLLDGRHKLVVGAVVLGTYGVLYLAATAALRVPEASAVVAMLRRRRRG